MDILFENKYTRDNKWAKDVYGYLNFRRPLHIAFYVFFGLFISFHLFMFFVYGNIASLIYLIIPAFWFAFVIMMYFKNIRITMQRDMEMHGKPIEISVMVTDEIITQKQSTGSELKLNFSDIKKAVVTKNYIYLWSKTNLIYSFKKDGFIVGNAADFLTFLKSKGIKVK